MHGLKGMNSHNSVSKKLNQKGFLFMIGLSLHRINLRQKISSLAQKTLHFRGIFIAMQFRFCQPRIYFFGRHKIMLVFNRVSQLSLRDSSFGFARLKWTFRRYSLYKMGVLFSSGTFDVELQLCNAKNGANKRPYNQHCRLKALNPL